MKYEINKINKCILVVIVRAHACFLYVFDAVFVLRICYQWNLLYDYNTANLSTFFSRIYFW